MPGLQSPHEGDDHPARVLRLGLNTAHTHTVGNRVDPVGDIVRARTGIGQVGGATTHPVGHRVRDAHCGPGGRHLTAQHLRRAGGVHQRAVTTLLIDQRSIDLQDPGNTGGGRDVSKRRGEQGVALVDQVGAVSDHPGDDPLRGVRLRLLPLSGLDVGHGLQVQLEVGEVVGNVLSGAHGVQGHLMADGSQLADDLLDVHRGTLGPEHRDARVAADVGDPHQAAPS